MALVLQTDDGTTANANAYISLAEFQSYCADHGLNLDDYDETEHQSPSILVATAYIDTFAWNGRILYELQTTEFPRECLYDRSGRLVEGIFPKLKSACCEYAYQALLNGGRLELTPQVGPNGLIALSETKKLGPLEKTTSYMASAAMGNRSYPNADKLLAEFRKSIGPRVIR